MKVRVIRTWHVEVKPAYGDTPESLVEKALAGVKGKPDSETAVILPEKED